LDLASLAPHHQESIAHAVAHFRREEGVLALLLGGSLAHGFGSPGSDVDVLIVVSDAERAARMAEGRMHFFDRALCTYEGGYVDGKYVSPGFLSEVAAHGSEPARFAFQDAVVLFSRDPAVAPLLSRIARYPAEERGERVARFFAQFEAWAWYAGEALKRADSYLLSTAASKLALFAARLVLAHNAMLFPYHKWLLRQLEQAPEKPAGMVEAMRDLCAAPTRERVDAFAALVRGFRAWESGALPWPVRFMADTELQWTRGEAAIEDL
jgi:hypothetical protein